jgi:hypothetical protein
MKVNKQRQKHFYKTKKGIKALRDKKIARQFERNKLALFKILQL